jgi:hypothetical protein
MRAPGSSASVSMPLTRTAVSRSAFCLRCVSWSTGPGFLVLQEPVVVGREKPALDLSANGAVAASAAPPAAAHSDAVPPMRLPAHQTPAAARHRRPLAAPARWSNSVYLVHANRPSSRDCAAVRPDHLHDELRRADRACTDSETWCGSIHPMQALSRPTCRCRGRYEPCSWNGKYSTNPSSTASRYAQRAGPGRPPRRTSCASATATAGSVGKK